MEQYDVSVIIPIFNCEEYIRDCVKSVLNQDYNDLSKIQIILVDDGSTDGSLNVCNELKNSINELTIDIITGPNGGVSSARNKGLDIAKGKYILYLDADDFISKNALSSLVEFFDKHYDEIDIVTYNFYRYMQATKKKRKFDRSKNFNRGTDVYDLDGDDFYVVQPSMNVFVKNYYKDNVKFDTTIKYHEDTKYNTMIMMKKKKIGFVEEARYYYRKYLGQVTDIKSNAYFNFYDMMNLFNYCIENYTREDGKIEKNIQALIVHVIRSKLLGKIQNLFPNFNDEKETEDARKSLIEVLKKVDNEIIVNDMNLDKYHKMYLLQLKEIDFDIYSSHGNKITINSKGTVLEVINDIDIVYSRFKVKNGKIKIMAHLRSPILWLRKPKLFFQYTDAENNKIKEEIKLKDTNAELYKTNARVAKFYGFEYTVDLKIVKDFEFKVAIDDNNMQVRTFFDSWTPFNSKVRSYKIYDGKTRVQYKKNKFLITHPKKKTRRKDVIRAIKRYNKVNPRINFYRLFAKPSKNIWIYNDRAGVFDNGYLQFKHDVAIKDGIKRYYALDGKMDKSKFTFKERRHVIKFGSFKHKLLFLKSDKIITSFANLQEYAPFAKKINCYKDILKYDLIYLQHGVLHATALKIYSKEFTPIDKIVVSSEFEEKNFINKYNYSEEDLIKSGMPRLDDKNENTIPENRIIFAPSWREYLIGGMVNRKRNTDEKKFLNSNYYKNTIEFFKNEKLLKVLKEKNIVIDFKLHPIFEPYSKCFKEIENDNITVTIGNTDLNKYKAFITDFSSYQFDFVNLARPICYFVPDMQEFKAGLNSYRELDLKYEDAFGKLCLTSDDLVDEIIKIINSNFEPETIYKKRMEDFFFKIDNCKDKLYEILKEE